MSDCLRSRSLVDQVFVSYSCSASDVLDSRDKKQEEVLGNGNTQGKSKHFKIIFRIITVYQTCFVL